MIDVVRMGLGLAQGLAVLALAPGLLGLIRWIKARAQGRTRGPAALLQPYRDMIRLARQPAVRSQRTTWVFGAAPVVLWTCYATLAFAVPVLGGRPLLAIDLITLIYLLAFARFALALAGLDAGAPFGSLGSSRAMFLSIPTELALVLIGAALALHWKALDLSRLVELQGCKGLSFLLQADLVLIAAAMYLTLALEVCRLPIDNPATHLELTMSHKAITLEYAGRDLALIEWAEAVKFAVLLTLFSSLFLMPLWTAPSCRMPDLAQPITKAIASVAMIFLVVFLLARSEITWPKVRLRKAVHRAVLAAGLSLAAILYRVVADLGVVP